MAAGTWIGSVKRWMSSRRARRLIRSYIPDDDLPGFDTAFYCGKYPDVAASGMDPLTHYLIHGWVEGRDPSAGFSSSGYLTANADIKAKGLNPLLHFLQHGISEGRGGWQSGYHLEERADDNSFREDVFHYYRKKARGE